jgi:autotransporter-associated beta strand protein
VNLLAPLLSVGANGSSTRFDGSLTGPGGLAKLGSGSFTLAGSNSFKGDLQASAGRLQLDGAGAVPASATVNVAGGATLELLSDQSLSALTGSGEVLLNPFTLSLGAGGRDSRFDGVLAGSGGLTKLGGGTLSLTGANSFTGATRVSGGVLALDGAHTLTNRTALTIDAGAQVRVSTAQAVGSLAGAGTLQLDAATLATGADERDSRFDGVISGSGGLTKQGAGTLTLTAAHRNSGATVIEAGTLRLASAGALGTGEIQNQGTLSLDRAEALTLDQAVSGRGALVVAQGQVTLANAANSYSGATRVDGGTLITTAAERLPDASALTVAAGARLQLGGNETVASLDASGSVRLSGDFSTRGQQVYRGSLTLANAGGLTLSGTVIDASRSSNDFTGTPLSLSGGQALVTLKQGLQINNLSLTGGGRIEADRLALNGKLALNGGNLTLVATAAPDDAKATTVGTAQVPVVGLPLATAEATVQQGGSGSISVAEGAGLVVQATGGGSVLLAQDANAFKGSLSVLSGPNFDTAWAPNVRGTQGIQSLVQVAGQQITVGGSGIEADRVSLRAGQLATMGEAKLVARLPFDEILLGKALSAPSMTLELLPAAFDNATSFGSISGTPIRVEVGSTLTGARSTGPNAGFLTVLPKAGAKGSTAIVLVGPAVGSVGSGTTGGAPYRFLHDGASQAVEIPVVYNGVLPLTPAANGALSSINGDAEEARKLRFQETVRTENVTVRLRSGVIAEVGAGRPATQGSEGARPPESCEPKADLQCK